MVPIPFQPKCCSVTASRRVTVWTDRNIDILPNLQRGRVHTRIRSPDCVDCDVVLLSDYEECVASLDLISRVCSFFLWHTWSGTGWRDTAVIVRLTEVGRDAQDLACLDEVRVVDTTRSCDITHATVERCCNLLKRIAGHHGVVRDRAIGAICALPYGQGARDAVLRDAQSAKIDHVP